MGSGSRKRAQPRAATISGIRPANAAAMSPISCCTCAALSASASGTSASRSAAVSSSTATSCAAPCCAKNSAMDKKRSCDGADSLGTPGGRCTPLREQRGMRYG